MVLIEYWMRLTLVLLALCAVNTNTKRIKKIESTEEISTTEISNNKKQSIKIPENAIIAIEVINPNSTETKDGKGRKRTIESALGYGHNGYQSFFDVKPKPPKYEVYKYSQHDIPPIKNQGYAHNTEHSQYQNHNQGSHHSSYLNHKDNGPHTGLGAHTGDESQFEIQKSVQYDLGTTVHHNYQPKKTSNLQQYYQNGATLFSSVDQNGHLSSLSSQVPTGHSPMVPVIVLRVYTNQLTQAGGLHPNIPNGHPYVNLNNIDLQSLLAGYVHNHPQAHQQYYDNGNTQQHQQQYQYQSSAEHQQPDPEPVYYQPAQPHSHHDPNTNQDHNSGLLTNENYPDDAHTKVIFKPKATKSRSKHRPPAQKFKITIPENTFSKVEIQDHTYGGPHDAGQYVQQHVEYAAPSGHGYDQQSYYYQQQPNYHYQQEYQPSVQYQQVQQIQQVQVSQDSQSQNHHGDHQQQQQQPQTELQYKQTSQEEIHNNQQQINSPENAHPPNQPDVQIQHYDPKQYVQIAYSNQVQEQPQQPEHTQHQTYYQEQYVQYQQNPEIHSAHHQHQQQQQQSYNQPTGTEVQYLQRPAEQGVENQDYSLVKHSNDAGRDLHPKLYNYHAHTARPRGTQKKKRERKTRVPLVLAPKVMESLENLEGKHRSN